MGGYIPVIAGSGRSGTTWVQDALAQTNYCSTAFEPLHPEAVPEAARYAGLYLPADESCPELHDMLTVVFAGDAKNDWINFRVRPDRLRLNIGIVTRPRKLYEWLRRRRKLARNVRIYSKYRGARVLTKFIRANLLLPWMNNQFKARIACIVRHPGAVIESKIRLGGDDWDPDMLIERYYGQQKLVDDVLSRAGSIQWRRLSPVGKHALIWCIENAKILADWESEGLHRCYFEDLVYKPDSAWADLCRFLEFDLVPETAVRVKASQQARPEQQNGQYNSSQLMRWQQYYSDAEQEEIQQLLDLFQIRDYSMSSGLPIIREAQ